MTEFQTDVGLRYVEELLNMAGTAEPCLSLGNLSTGGSRASRFCFQDLRFPSFPRQRQSSKLLKGWDARFGGYDEFTVLAKVVVSVAS